MGCGASAGTPQHSSTPTAVESSSAPTNAKKSFRPDGIVPTPSSPTQQGGGGSLTLSPTGSPTARLGSPALFTRRLIGGEAADPISPVSASAPNPSNGGSGAVGTTLLLSPSLDSASDLGAVSMNSLGEMSGSWACLDTLLACDVDDELRVAPVNAITASLNASSLLRTLKMMPALDSPSKSVALSLPDCGEYLPLVVEVLREMERYAVRVRNRRLSSVVTTCFAAGTSAHVALALSEGMDLTELQSRIMRHHDVLLPSSSASASSAIDPLVLSRSKNEDNALAPPPPPTAAENEPPLYVLGDTHPHSSSNSGAYSPVVEEDGYAYHESLCRQMYRGEKFRPDEAKRPFPTTGNANGGEAAGGGGGGGGGGAVSSPRANQPNSTATVGASSSGNRDGRTPSTRKLSTLYRKGNFHITRACIPVLQRGAGAGAGAAGGPSTTVDGSGSLGLTRSGGSITSGEFTQTTLSSGSNRSINFHRSSFVHSNDSSSAPQVERKASFGMGSPSFNNNGSTNSNTPSQSNSAAASPRQTQGGGGCSVRRLDWMTDTPAWKVAALSTGRSGYVFTDHDDDGDDEREGDLLSADSSTNVNKNPLALSSPTSPMPLDQTLGSANVTGNSECESWVGGDPTPFVAVMKPNPTLLLTVEVVDVEERKKKKDQQQQGRPGSQNKGPSATEALLHSQFGPNWIRLEIPKPVHQLPTSRSASNSTTHEGDAPQPQLSLPAPFGGGSSNTSLGTFAPPSSTSGGSGLFDPQKEAASPSPPPPMAPELLRAIGATFFLDHRDELEGVVDLMLTRGPGKAFGRSDNPSAPLFLGL